MPLKLKVMKSRSPQKKRRALTLRKKVKLKYPLNIKIEETAMKLPTNGIEKEEIKTI